MSKASFCIAPCFIPQICSTSCNSPPDKGSSLSLLSLIHVEYLHMHPSSLVKEEACQTICTHGHGKVWDVWLERFYTTSQIPTTYLKPAMQASNHQTRAALKSESAQSPLSLTQAALFLAVFAIAKKNTFESLNVVSETNLNGKIKSSCKS